MLDNLKDRLPRITYFDNMDGLAKQNLIMHLIFTVKSLIVVSLVMYFRPEMVPFKLLEFWTVSGSLLDWLTSGKWLLIWGAVVTLVWCVYTHNEPRNNRYAERIFGQGIKLSIAAGIGQEILFRWGYLLSGIIMVQVFDYLLGGFLFGNGLLHLVYTNVLGPIANLTTFGTMSEFLVQSDAWAVGAGMLATNLAYRDGHKYTGKFGVLSAWFVGMAFFYFMFTYGLLAAILLHILYNLVIFGVVYLDMVVERYRGRA